MLGSECDLKMYSAAQKCDSYATDYDIKFNCEIKSAALRIGPRHCYSCAELTLNGKSLVYVTSIKYLDVHIRNGRYSRYSRYTAVPNFTVPVPWGSRYTVEVTVLHGTI